MMEGTGKLCKKCVFTRVLVVGHGPSFRDFEFIRNFDGLILSVDFSGKELVENGIIPDYILFSEINEGVINFTDHTLPPMYTGMPITFVHKKDMIRPVIELMDSLKLKREIFIPLYTTAHLADANVGLYSIAYAQMMLFADEIHLIGMDYKGKDSGGHDYSDIWIRKTKHYMSIKRPNIIDHSGGNFPVDGEFRWID